MPYVLLIISASIMQGPNGMQPPVNTIKLENPGYYCNSYTPPAPEHTSMMASGAYSEYMYWGAPCWNIKTTTFSIFAWTFEVLSEKGLCSSYRMWSFHRSVMKSSVFWDLKSCSLLKVNWCFRGRCCLHLHGQRRSKIRCFASCHPASLLLGLFLDHEDEGDKFVWNVRSLLIHYMMLYPREDRALPSNFITSIPYTVHWYAGEYDYAITLADFFI
jgi:hypothetical protein